jgi:hypothetical protein
MLGLPPLVTVVVDGKQNEIVIELARESEVLVAD